MTYHLEVDVWDMKVRDEDMIIIIDAHQIFLEDDWEFDKLHLTFMYWPYETPKYG